ncbi:hypothetical protein [Nostoc sp. MG11]|nr:hypothetical protein [Nostoc sp. MG11]
MRNQISDYDDYELPLTQTKLARGNSCLSINEEKWNEHEEE